LEAVGTDKASAGTLHEPHAAHLPVRAQRACVSLTAKGEICYSSDFCELASNWDWAAAGVIGDERMGKLMSPSALHHVYLKPWHCKLWHLHEPSYAKVWEEIANMIPPITTSPAPSSQTASHTHATSYTMARFHRQGLD